MIFQIATAENLSAIASIDTLCANDPLRRRMIEQAVANDEAYLMLEGDEMIGYAILTDLFFRKPFVEMLYVRATHRRKGFGIQAMQYLEKIAAHTHTVMWTSTNQSNQPMRALLSKLDYKWAGSIDIDPGDLEFFFWKDLRKL